MDKLFKLIADNFKFPMWIKDMELNFIYANSEYIERFDNQANAILNKNTHDKFDEYCRKAIETKKYILEDVYIDNMYNKFYIQPIFDENNEMIAIAGIAGEIAHLSTMHKKDYEIEFQKALTDKIVNMLPGVVFFKDKNRKYVYANKECRDFYAKRGINNIIGKTDSEINKDKTQVEKFNNDDDYIINTKNSIYNEVSFKDINGDNIYKEVIKMPLLDSQGNVSGIVGRSLDVTERKLYQEKLEYMSYTDRLTGAKNRAFFEEREHELSINGGLPLGVIMGDANGLKLVNDTLGHREGDNLLIQIKKVLSESCGNDLNVFRIGGDEFIVLLPNSSIKECDQLIVDINNRCKEYTDNLFNISISLGSALKTSYDQDIYDVIKEAEDKVYRNKLLQNDSLKSSILNSLKIGLGVKSGENEQHSERVALSALTVGERLGLSIAERDELLLASDLHDIGKIGVSEDILLKSGKLTDEEYEIIKTHSEKGYRIIKASSELKSVAEAVLHHHERWDGKGYPMGLKGEEIPLLSRIISICDSFDVMISERLYKKAISVEEALAELRRCSGTQFDPKIVEIFIHNKCYMRNK